jgi:hypothetical protein
MVVDKINSERSSIAKLDIWGKKSDGVNCILMNRHVSIAKWYSVRLQCVNIARSRVRTTVGTVFGSLRQ